jgi:hypothetical protein
MYESGTTETFFKVVKNNPEMRFTTNFAVFFPKIILLRYKRVGLVFTYFVLFLVINLHRL